LFPVEPCHPGSGDSGPDRAFPARHP
jgi:hypothetical protein